MCFCEDKWVNGIANSELAHRVDRESDGWGLEPLDDFFPLFSLLLRDFDSPYSLPLLQLDGIRGVRFTITGR